MLKWKNYQKKKSSSCGVSKTEIQQALNKYLMINKLQSKVLTRDDKLKVISYMKNKGYISKKGAKTIISELLAISRPTLYKYLKEI